MPRLLPVASALLCAAFLLAVPEDARGFGRNKVQYDTFDWQVLVTDHLEIHFYPEERDLAYRAAEYGEAACRALDVDLGHTLTKRIPLIVYGSHYHFRQNNITPTLVGESTGGFTEIFRDRVALPYSGSEEDFRHVVHHELVHAYVFDQLYGGKFKSFFVLQYAFYIPLWFMEGIAEYYSNTWDSEAEMMLRDAAVSGALPPFERIHGGYFVYKSGWSAVGYLVDRHGEGVIRDILASMVETRDLRIAVEEVTGEKIEAISADWLEDVRRRSWPTIAELQNPDDFGRPLTASPQQDGTLNANAVLSPSGKRVAFLSNRSGTPDLMILDIDSDAPARTLVHGARGGKFESLHPLRSSFGWSPDENFLVAAAQKGARDALYILDVEDGRTVAELTPDLDAVTRPDWSPTEARFAFTGMRNGQVDLWTVEADGSGLRALTDDLAREDGARFSPDGRRIVFTTDHGTRDQLAGDSASADREAEEQGTDIWI
ncbi:MAG: hypothetical protein HKN12_02020, partial [Gemmatimonadetes bacterium]|nr:hypothetical protein [Gemmatimonadota bacterium]